MSVEATLCDQTGFTECVLFSRARVAIAYGIMPLDMLPLFIPSNVCPTLLNAFGPATRLIPVGSYNGLAAPTGGIVVQLYGYRQEYEGFLEVDPLLTLWRRESQCESAVVSFGYSKTIDLDGGAAFLTRNKGLADNLRKLSDWPGRLTEYLERELGGLDENIKRRKERAEWWKKYLPSRLIEPLVGSPQVIPWRVIRRVPNSLSVDYDRSHFSLRDDLAGNLRLAGFDAGTNYPPLPGCTDPGSVKWGKEVINLWVSEDYDEPRIRAACEVIKRTIE